MAKKVWNSRYGTHETQGMEHSDSNLLQRSENLELQSRKWKCVTQKRASSFQGQHLQQKKFKKRTYPLFEKQKIISTLLNGSQDGTDRKTAELI